MKSFKQYITEENIETVVESIAEDCQPFLNEVNYTQSQILSEKHLYHGMGNASGDIIRKSVRKDRIPTDMPESLHNILDNAFNDYYGHHFRSNSVFTSPSEEQVETYGNIFAIFPIGKYEYIWSESIADLYSNLRTIMKKYIKDMYGIDIQKEGPSGLPGAPEYAEAFFNENIPKSDDDWIKTLKNTELDKEMVKNVLNEIVKNEYKQKGISSVIRRKGINEIMIVCDEYYAIDKNIVADREFKEKFYEII